MMSEVARKILSKDPAAEAQRKKDVEEAQVAGGQYHGKTKQKNPNVRIAAHDAGACLPLWVQWVLRDRGVTAVVTVNRASSFSSDPRAWTISSRILQAKRHVVLGSTRDKTSRVPSVDERRKGGP